MVVPGDVPHLNAQNVPEGSSRGVQFGPSGKGLPGGDMQLGRNIGVPVTSSVRESSPEALGAGGPSMLALPEFESNDNVVENASTVPEPPVDENGHKYVGLVNQAMTCYLNSLVQSLYMTPEFRNAIYQWEYKKTGKGAGESSIPCQIQKLFLLLQTTDRDSLETKDLTASFGWQGNEAYDQHDVQELCRLMFDALELKWKGTQHEKLIQNLYRGTMQDFVKCLKCGRENVRADVFLDLPLAVKPFGAIEAFKSVEEALNAFITPELLEGTNQYNCESCKSLQNAHKGLRVTQFPYLLTIQLKRFDFDYNTMHRIKLNDRMTFPDILNLNPFVHPNGDDVLSKSENQPTSKNTDGHVLVGQLRDKAEINRLLKQGPYVYELFSVMVHQGSAAGGHYFAYIKNMELDRWYCFNDTRVETAGSAEIALSFGGSYGGWSTSNTNAYMLMYRKIDQQNAMFIRTPDLPHHITDLKIRWKELEAAKERQRLYRESLVKVTVRLNMACDSEKLLSKYLTLNIPRTNPISDIYNQAFKFFDEKTTELCGTGIIRNLTRLIRYQSQGRMTMLETYVSKAELSKKVESCFGSYLCPMDLLFLLDVRTKAGSIPFAISPSNGRTIRVSRVDIAARAVRPAFFLYVNPTKQTVIEVKQLIGSVLDDGQRASIESRLVLEKNGAHNSELCLLDSPILNFTAQLEQCFSSVPLVYYDGGCKGSSAETEEDRKKELNKSIMYEILDRKKFAWIIRVKFPSEEEINRANVASHVTADSSVGASEVKSVHESVVSSSMEVSASYSERASSRSSMISDDANMADSSDSMCQNTPQISPNVSDVDEGIDETELMVASALALKSAGSGRDSCSTSTIIADGNGDCSQSIIELPMQENLHNLDVDKRITVGSLKTWLAGRLGVDSTQFVIVKHHDDDPSDKGYESNAKDEDSVEQSFGTVRRLSIKLRPPLKGDEKLIRVVLLDFEELSRENWRMLFECPASKQTLVKDIMIKCLRLYSEIYGQHLQLNQIRLRDVQSMTMNRAVLRPNDTLDSRGTQWSNNIYLQIINDERLINAPGIPVLLRRFRPSTVEVSPVHEALVDPSASDQVASLKQSISTLSGIPVERILFTEPPTQWDKWPYLRSRLDMLDGTVKFWPSPLLHGHDQLIDKVGGRIIYYRDSNEEIKQLSEEERKQIKIKENGQQQGSAITRRKERPLRIQMSSISEP